MKDSGGDVFKQIKRGRPNFHCCSPILSIHDQQRDASRTASIATMTKFSNVQRRALDKYNSDVKNKTSIFFCNKVSENCDVKAPFMMFLHSTYDRTTTDIANAMTAADAKVATGSFIFHPNMLVQSSGELKHLKASYEITSKDGVRYVNMSFVGDASWAYTHRLDTYLALMRNSVIKDSNGQCYFVSIMSTRNSVAFFKIIKCASRNVLPGNIKHKLWFDNTELVTVQCYDWEAEGYDTVKNHMRLVRFLAPKKLVNDTMCYAYGLDHNKFSVANIYHALRSFSTRVVGTKAVCQAAYDMDPKRLLQLASAIFIKCFVDRFGITRATSEVTSEIVKLRDQKGLSIGQIFRNLWLKFVTPTAPQPENSDNVMFKEVIDNPGQVPLEGTSPLNEGKFWFERYLSFLMKWSAEPKNYSVHICDAVQFVEIENIIESDYSDLETRATNYLPCFPITNDDDPLRESPLSDDACDISSNDTTVDEAVPALCDLDAEIEESNEEEMKKSDNDIVPLELLQIGTAIGDGHCLFDSIRKCLNLNSSVEEIKQHMLRSECIADLPVREIPGVIKVLSTPHQWGGEPEILLASRVYNVRIVLYSDQLNYEPQVYNSESEGETIYLVLRNAHFEPAYPKRRRVSVNITLDDVSTDSIDLSVSSRDDSHSELNTSTPRKPKRPLTPIENSSSLSFSSVDDEVLNVNQYLEMMVTEANGFNNNISTYFPNVSHTCIKSLWTNDLDDCYESSVVEDLHLEAMLIEASNFKDYCHIPNEVKVTEIKRDGVFDLRPSLHRDAETSCDLDIEQNFVGEIDVSELKFHDNHFAEEETSKLETTAAKEITIQIDIPLGSTDDSKQQVMSDILPTPSLGRGLFRIFGKTTPKPNIKTYPKIKTDESNVFVKLFKKKEPRPSEVADLTSKGDRPVYNKSPKKTNKKLKVKSKPLLKQDPKDKDIVNKKSKDQNESSDNSILDVSVIEDFKTEIDKIIDSFPS